MDCPEVHVHYDEVKISTTDGTPSVVVLETEEQTVVIKKETDNVLTLSPEYNTVVISETGIQGPPGPQGPSGSGSTIITGVAGETLSGHRAVTQGPSGFVYASVDDLDHLTDSIYLTLNSAVAGGTINVLSSGDAKEVSWNWTPGQFIYLGLNGNLVQSPPTGALFLRVLGASINSDEIQWDPRSPITLA